jgi:hypothetical protein
MMPLGSGFDDSFILCYFVETPRTKTRVEKREAGAQKFDSLDLTHSVAIDFTSRAPPDARIRL